MSTVEVKVPDIGDFDDVEIIEVLVAAGDTVAEEDSLITVETDKATMEIPSPVSGIVQSLNISVGDKVSQGALVCTVVVEGDAPVAATESAPVEETATEAPKAETPSAPVEAPAAASFSGDVDEQAELVVLGSGPRWLYRSFPCSRFR